MFTIGRKGYSPRPKAILNTSSEKNPDSFEIGLFEFARTIDQDTERIEPTIVSSGSSYRDQVSSDRYLSGSVPLVESVLGSDSMYLSPVNGYRSRIRVEVVKGNPNIEDPRRYDPRIPHRERNFPRSYFYSFGTLNRPGMICSVGRYIERRTKDNASGRRYEFPDGREIFQTEWDPRIAVDAIPMHRLTSDTVHEKPQNVPPDGVLIGVSAEFL